MKHEYVVHGSLAMGRGSVLRVEDGAGVLIYVWEGALWLTQEGDARDRHLGAGSWFRLDRDGVTLAQATSRSTVTLTAPAPERYARRIALGQMEIYSPARARFWARLLAPHARPTTAAP
jgi:hypothetical protein